MNPFSDIADDDQFLPDLDWALQAGIIAGYPDYDQPGKVRFYPPHPGAVNNTDLWEVVRSNLLRTAVWMSRMGRKTLKLAEMNLKYLRPTLRQWAGTVRVAGAEGAGFFVAPEHVITAAHVVAGATAITIYLRDALPAPLRLLGTDDDLAVLEFAGFNPPAVGSGAKLGNDPQPDDFCAAYGAPFGLEDTLTTGTVTGEMRFISGQPRVQVDAAINPGNSGGPLVDEDGRVIGVVVSKVMDADNTAFVIPASRIRALCLRLGVVLP